MTLAEKAAKFAIDHVNNNPGSTYLTPLGEGFVAGHAEGKKDGYRDALEGEEVKEMARTLYLLISHYEHPTSEGDWLGVINKRAIKAVREFEKARGGK